MVHPRPLTLHTAHAAGRWQSFDGSVPDAGPKKLYSFVLAQLRKAPEGEFRGGISAQTRAMVSESHRGYLTHERGYKLGPFAPAAFVKRNELLGSAGSGFRGRRAELNRVRHEFAFGGLFRVNDDAITHVQIR